MIIEINIYFIYFQVHPSHNCLYIPFDGEEVSIEEYEVAVLC